MVGVVVVMVGGSGPQRSPETASSRSRGQGGAQPLQADISAVAVEVVVGLQVHEGTRAQRDVRLDLLARPVHVLWHARHLEHRVLLAAGCDDVGVRLLLDALDGGALGPDDQPHHTVRNAYLDGGLAGEVGRTREGTSGTTAAPGALPASGLAARGTDHGEVLGGRDDLALGHLDILAAARHDEHRLLASHWRLNVRVSLGTQGLDLTA